MSRLIILIISLFVGQFSVAQQSYQQTLKLMGTRFDITVVADNETAGNAYIQLAIDEISRIEKMISSWDPKSQTSAINQAAGKEAVKVDRELFELISRAIKISKLTSGAFDISYASMDRIWKYDGSITVMPDQEAVRQSVAIVGYDNIILNAEENTVFLKEEGMRIGFGAIGKGYAADKAKALLKNKGVRAGIINAAGDLHAWGQQANGDDWKVAITNPLNKQKAFAWLPVINSSVVTSGNYEKYIEIDDQRYSHIIDPRTGYPAKGLVSVSIFSRSAELSDALATAVFVMGREVGLDFVNQLEGIECILVDDQNQVHTSDNIDLDKTRFE